jgi:quercetin dioxygenase-like cupin family protein
MSNPPNIKIGMIKNVWTRSMHFKEAGDIEQCHTHQFHHATLVAHGSVQVTAKGKTTVFKSPHLIWIHKDVEHELMALEPNTVCACIHGLRDEHEEIVDPESIPDGVTYEASSRKSLLP